MAASVRKVAELAGVSVGTVSNFLNRPASVAPDTAARVERAIKALGFVPNGAARQLRAGRSTSIGLLVLDVSNPFFTDVARGVERRADVAGLSVLLANSAQDPAREELYLDLFEKQRVAGVLVSPIGDAMVRLRQLRDRGMPVVLVDRRSDDPTFSSVAVDDFGGGRLAVDHLLAQGRRTIAVVGGPLHIRQVADRFRGAVEAARAVPGARVDLFESTSLSFDEGRRMGTEVVAARANVGYDAVFALNDLLAIGVQQALFSAAPVVAIPDDLAIVGYDDIDFAAAAAVPITSVRQPREAMGATAVELLLEVQDPPDLVASRQVVFEPELVVRESTAAVPTRR